MGLSGHDVQIAEGWQRVAFGRGQIIRREADGVLWGGSDPRADGCSTAPSIVGDRLRIHT